MNDAQELLTHSALFAGASQTTIERFLACADTIRFAPGEISVAETTVTDQILMVVEGELRISVELDASPDFKFLRGTPGTFLGLINFFAEASQPVTATAVTGVQALVWKAADWRRLADADPAFGCQLAQRIGRELVGRMSKWINQLLNNVNWIM